MITWRDDDIGARTKYKVLADVNDIFQRHGATHTIAVMAAGMDKRSDLVQLILARRMVVQLHCWTHEDLTIAEFRAQLPAAVDMLADLFGVRPTILYPPWNRTDPGLMQAAAALGLTVSADKISLEQYIRANGDVKEDVVNFHHWHAPDVAQIDQALRIYKGK